MSWLASANIDLRRGITPRVAVFWVVAEVVGGIVGVFTAHNMFDGRLIGLSTTGRNGVGQWVGEFVATCDLVGTILGCLMAWSGVR